MCEFSKKLVAFLDGELAAGEAIELERHLDTCADCRNSLRRYERLSHNIDAYCDTKVVGSTPGTLVARRSVLFAVGAAAVVAIVAMLVFLPRSAPLARIEKPVAIVSHSAPVPVVAEGHRPAAASVRKIRRHPVAPVAPIQQASWTSAEPAIEIAIPANDLLPPGAVPEGVTFIANVRFPAVGQSSEPAGTIF